MVEDDVSARQIDGCVCDTVDDDQEATASIRTLPLARGAEELDEELKDVLKLLVSGSGVLQRRDFQREGW